MPKGIILSLPARMNEVTIAFSQEEREKILSILQKLGAVHVEEFGKGGEAAGLARRRLEEINRVRSRLAILARILGKDIVLDVDVTLDPFKLESVAKKGLDSLNKLLSKLEAGISRASELEGEIEEISFLVKVLERIQSSLGDIEVATLNYRGRHVFSIALIGPLEGEEPLLRELGDNASLVHRVRMNEDVILIIMGLSDQYGAVSELARERGFSAIDLPDLPKDIRKVGDARDYLSRILESKSEDLDELRSSLEEEVKGKLQEIGLYVAILDAEADRLSALLMLNEGKYLAAVRGWLPVDSSADLRSLILRETETGAILISKPRSGEPPTKMENHKGIDYYEPLVRFYGIPNYEEWDPTPIIAYSFALFFGLMLADLGYAIALLVAIKLLLHKFVEDPTSPFFQKFKKMMYVNAFSSLAFGALSATALGFQLPYRPILTFPLEPTAFIKASLVIGLTHILIAHGIAAARGVKERDSSAFLNEVGIVAITADILFLFVLSYRFHRPVVDLLLGTYLDFHNPHTLFVLGMFGVVLVGKLGRMGGLGVLLSLFDLTGILGDVLSYARIAGVGMATLFLASGFNLMIGMFQHSISGHFGGVLGLALGAIAAFPIFAFAHILNLGLSSLGAGVHSLRLCFVEFLTKFYEGQGRDYRPLKLPVTRRIRIVA